MKRPAGGAEFNGRMKAIAVAGCLFLLALGFQNCSDPGFQSLVRTADSSIECSEMMCRADQSENEHIRRELSIEIQPVTSAFRFSATMYGGWGPHLGRLLRDASGTKWFVSDTGNDAARNAGLKYFRHDFSGWTEIATTSLPGTVQQNVASITDGLNLLSYGIDVQFGRLIECKFNLVKQQSFGCVALPFSTGRGSNYVGATVKRLSDGSVVKLVWWTNVQSGGGSWSYVFDSGNGWSGPNTSSVSGYSDFSYVYARIFEQDGVNSTPNFVVIGAGAKGVGGSQVGYDTLVASGKIGDSLTNWMNIQVGGIGNEVWVDSFGGAHLFSYPGATYFYLTQNGQLSKVDLLAENAIGARLVEVNSKIHLAIARNDGSLSVFSSEKPKVPGRINWNDSDKKHFASPFGSGNLTIFPESTMYQVADVPGLNLAAVGSLRQFDVRALSFYYREVSK